MPARRTRSDPKPRRPGRPRNARGDQRGRLLDAAVTLFARRGIASTPLSAVARAARVTPALVHYYFGSRERLVDAIIAERLEPLVMTFAAHIAANDGTPHSLISGFVRSMVGVLDANPWFPPLWVREVVTEGGQLRERLLERGVSRIAPGMRDFIAAAQARGQINRDLDPRLTMVSLISLTLFTIAAAPIWRRLLDAEDVTADVIVRHTLALLERGLEFSNV